MSRIIAIGDTHVHQDARNALRLSALDQIVTAARQMTGVGAVVWAGDLFHARSTADDRNQLAQRLIQLAELAPVVICRGNHDGPGELDIFASLKAPHAVHVVTSPQALRLRLATGEFATVAVLPYPEKGGLVGAGVAHGDLVDTAGGLLEPTFMLLAHALERARQVGDLTWFMGHVNIAGSVMSSGQPSIGQELEISRAHLDRLGPILKIVNHVHHPQEIAGAIYPGSIAPMDWGERHECRFLDVEFRTSADFAVRPVRLVMPMLFHVAGTLASGGFALDVQGDVEVERRFAANDWADAEVRVRYAYNASERAVLDEQVIRDRFASALRLKIEGVVVPDRELRAPGVATARTLVEKLQAMRPESPLPASLANKVAALEQREAEIVLADVRAWLATVEQSEKVEVAA